jgi:hypothetical protein
MLSPTRIVDVTVKVLYYIVDRSNTLIGPEISEDPEGISGNARRKKPNPGLSSPWDPRGTTRPAGTGHREKGAVPETGLAPASNAAAGRGHFGQRAALSNGS